tara:strand:- start:66 stop:1508 length:1443 start_codon:yes stop_codon:yes gene_type:complete
MTRRLKTACLSVIAMLLIAAAPAWDPTPWLDDLKQFRAAIDKDYPNLDWLTGQREVSLDGWFARTANDIRQSHNDADARRALDKLAERFNDGHLLLRWPARPSAGGTTASSSGSGSPPTIGTFCAAKGYDAGKVTVGTAVSLPGYRPIDTGGPFAAGLVDIEGKKVGVVRLGVFSPTGYPALCEQAVANTKTAFGKPCDETCDDRILTEAFAVMTRALMRTVERLRVVGADVLLADVTRNGGGTEWTEAAARIISPVSVRSAPIRVIRSDAWAKRLRALATKLRHESGKAQSEDRTMLRDLALRADTLADDLAPCNGAPCVRMAQVGFSSGLIPELPAGRFDGRDWGPDVFSASQFPYRDHVWKGPVIVLVDNETWSAAEQFAALLQDNNAAIVMGTRTGGAGCGHIYGNVPIALSQSGGQLELPNCARFRKDGSNEVSGVIPDVLTGVRWNDGPAYAGQLTASHLSEAIARAETLHTSH